MNNTLVVNLFAGPGTGKSSTMAYLFSQLKWLGVNCEMAPEYAKEIVWTETPTSDEEVRPVSNKLFDQKYIFGKQQHRIRRLNKKVSVIITDSPILLSMLYGDHLSNSFKILVKETHEEFTNMNIFLERSKVYNPKGRTQNEDGAKALDVKLMEILAVNDIPFTKYTTDKESLDNIVKEIINLIK